MGDMPERRTSSGRRLTDFIGHIQAKNWRQFQHYSHRNPPWIRLHKRLLDDDDFHELPDASQLLAFKLWLLASESDDGTIEWKPKRIAFRLRMQMEEILERVTPLIEKGFFVTVTDCTQPDSIMLAPSTQLSTTDTDDSDADSERTLLAPLAIQVRKPTDAEFVYSEYPRKVGKRKALAAIEQSINRLLRGEQGSPFSNSDEALAFLVQRTKAFAKSPKGQAGDYTPHPATWFNRSSYLDDDEVWYGGQNGNSNHRPRGNPQCADCNGAGVRASKLTPGRTVVCECVPGEVAGTV